MSGVLETVRELFGARDTGEVLRRIAARARELLACSTSAVYLLEAESGGFRAAATEGLYADQLAGEVLRPGRGILGSVAGSGRAEIVNDTNRDPRALAVPGTPDTEDGEKLMAAPLRSRGRVIGVMAAWRDPGESRFGETDLAALEGLAVIAVIAIENARSYEEDQLRINRLSSLTEIGRALAAAHDQGELLDTVYRQASRVFDTTNFYIATYLQGSDEWVWELHYEGGVRQAPERHKLGAGLTGHIIRNRLPVLLQSREEIRAFLEGQGVAGLGDLPQSWMGIPLLAGDEITGVMAIQNYRVPALYGQADLDYFSLIGTEVAVALQNARLLESARRDARRLHAINEVSRIVSSELDRVNIMKLLGMALSATVPFDAFYGAVRPSGQDGLWFPVAMADGAFSMPGDRSIAACPRLARALEARLPMIGSAPADSGGDALESGPLAWTGDPETDLALAQSRGSWALLPMFAGDEAMGALAFLSRTRDAFGQEHLDLLAGAGRQTAVALRNARSFEAAQAARAEAEAANRMKSSFLAKMSHELRTPLNAIINFAYLLNAGSEGGINPDQAAMIGRIEDAGRHLLGLINDILDLAKIEAGRMELSFEELELNALAGEVMHTASALVKDKPVELRFLPAPAETWVKADRTRIRQVLLNLVSNAAKFTERGRITVGIADRGDGFAAVSVGDTGIGIAPEYLSSIFLEFVQADDSDARKAGGTGLGLPISRHFVEMHGGAIVAESRKGEGSTFTFTLPLLLRAATRLESADRVPDAVRDAASAAGREGRTARVLLIDDDPDARLFLSRGLAHGDYEVSTLRDPGSSIRVACETRPDVIVLDIMMPGTDGWGILHALKADPATKDIPVIICSALRERGNALFLEATDCIRKPLDPEELRAMASRYAPEGGSVLAIDDDPDSLEIVRRILSASPVSVRCACDGTQGLRMLREERPDVLILDLMLPGMDGFEILSRLRADPSTAGLPVVVVTAKELGPAEREFLESQATALLLKGDSRPEDLERAVMDILGRAVTRHAGSRP